NKLIYRIKYECTEATVLLVIELVQEVKNIWERLNLLGKLGCLLCILGSTVMVIHSPKNSEIKTMEELLHKVQQPAILTLVGVFIIAAIIGIVFLAPRWGQTNVVVYVFICSTLGALTVTGAKGMGVALKQTFEGEQQFTNWLTYVMLAVVAVNILFQINFLNKALDTFNTAVVTPTYYVLFNSAVAIVTLTLFQEFNQLTVYDIIGEIIGFFVIVVGIFVLNAFKDMDISLRNLPKAKKAGQEIDINDGTKMPVLKKDNDLVLEIRENESEDENDSLLLECHDSPVYVDDDHLEIGEVAFKMPKRFFSNGHLKANGHVNKLDIEDDKHFNNEVTHF
ncbi:NIPA2-like protein, partial [Mya arenaria]